MAWIIAYLISMFIVPAFFGGIVLGPNNKVTIQDGEDVFNVMGFCLLWPIFVSVYTYNSTKKKYKDYYEERHKEIVHKYRLDYVTGEERTLLVDVPEGDLKFLLKAHRKKKLELSKLQLMLVRDELSHRNMERCLLK